MRSGYTLPVFLFETGGVAQGQRKEVRIVDDTRDPQSPIQAGGKLFVREEIRNQELLVSFEGNVIAKNITITKSS